MLYNICYKRCTVHTVYEIKLVMNNKLGSRYSKYKKIRVYEDFQQLMEINDTNNSKII